MLYPGKSLKRIIIGPFFPMTNSENLSPPVLYSISIFCLAPFLWMAFKESYEYGSVEAIAALRPIISPGGHNDSRYNLTKLSASYLVYLLASLSERILNL